MGIKLKKNILKQEDKECIVWGFFIDSCSKYISKGLNGVDNDKIKIYSLCKSEGDDILIPLLVDLFNIENKFCEFSVPTYEYSLISIFVRELFNLLNEKLEINLKDVLDRMLISLNDSSYNIDKKELYSLVKEHNIYSDAIRFKKDINTDSGISINIDTGKIDTLCKLSEKFNRKYIHNKGSYSNLIDELSCLVDGCNEIVKKEYNDKGKKHTGNRNHSISKSVDLKYLDDNDYYNRKGNIDKGKKSVFISIKIFL